jgi:integrase
MFQISEVQESPAFNGQRSFLTLRYREQWRQFHRIQRAAEIDLPCHGDHEHTPTCHVYGFHDVRRAFATENAANLSAVELQALMRHGSFTTTQGYINMAKQLAGGTEAKLFVPDVLKKEA